METTDKKEYELAFLAKAEEDAKDLIATLKKFEADVSFEGPVTRTTLAYEIKKEGVALFGYCHFSLLPEKTKDVSNELNIKPGIIRFLLITPPFSRQKPRPRDFQGGFGGGERMRPQKPYEAKPATLSNEALEKKIEEILQ
ncbi:MAG: 30S ribosomal protein S6 [Patescibacteria group bacterium]